MPALYYLAAAMLGLAVGSFLNVVVYRYGSGRSLSGRSFCASCARQLSWYELVPVGSFLALRGRCRTCYSKISWQYPIVELLTAAVFVFIAAELSSKSLDALSVIDLAFSLYVWPLLLAIFVYDIRHKIIPDGLVFSFIFLSLLYRLCYVAIGMSAPIDVAAGLILFAPFFLLWYFSDGRWMGLGDGKLAAGMGWMLGLVGGASAVVFGFWMGAIWGIAIITASSIQARSALRTNKKAGRVTLKSEVPFAPFLIAGVFVVEFLNVSLLKLWW